VPFYAGLTLEEIGGRGVRWQERQAASAFPAATTAAALDAPNPVMPGAPGAAVPAATNGHAANGQGRLRLGTYRSIWASPEVDISPALHFTVAHQQLELSPEDALRLQIDNGEQVEFAQNGTRLRARAAIRSGVLPGTAFLADGIATDSANALTEDLIEVRKPR
jgi:NADH-quinone oxidoreductase subunit G